VIDKHVNIKKRTHSYSTNSLFIKPHNTPANADTGATGHYIALPDSTSLVDLRPAGADFITVSLPDGATTKSTHIGLLNFPTLPLGARTAHVFPDFVGSLLSIGQLCDNGMSASFTKNSVTIYDETTNVVILTGIRNSTTRLYMVDISPSHSEVAPPVHATTVIKPTPYSAAAVVYHSNNAARVAYYHRSLGCPAVSTFEEAVNKKFVDFPGLTIEMVRRNPPHVVPTAQGHLNQTRQGLRSTRTHKAVPITANVVCRIFHIEEAVASDLTGRMVTASMSGMQYIMVSIHINLGYIHFEAVPSRAGPVLLAAHKRTIQFWTAHGHKPNHIMLDNEKSAELEAYLTDEAKMSFQYFPPGMHRANPAEKAIQTSKNHFIAILCAVDPAFPISLWDCLLPQAELSLNLLRASRVNPNVSAWEHLRGPYNFNKHPIAPAGIKVLSHDKPTARGTWEPHGEVGFYLGPALHHYRCYNVWIKATRAHRVTDTVTWFPVDVIVPSSARF
jgi:hypothetical protein